MEAITADNKERAIRVLVTAFKDNPGAQWVIKKDHRLSERLEALCRFCVEVSLLKHGAYISSDLKGVALFYNCNKRVSLFPMIKHYLLMIHFCVGWRRAWYIYNRERTITKRRFQKEHIYFWMLGVEDHTNGVSTVVEMRDFAFRYSRELQLPLVAETTSSKNVVLYQRFGFRIYDEWVVKEQNLTVWFMTRDWNL